MIDLDAINFSPSDDVLDSIKNRNQSNASTDNSFLIMEIKQVFKDQETDVLVSTELPIYYHRVFNLNLPANWLDLLLEFKDEFLITEYVCDYEYKVDILFH